MPIGGSPLRHGVCKQIDCNCTCNNGFDSCYQSCDAFFLRRFFGARCMSLSHVFESWLFECNWISVAFAVELEQSTDELVRWARVVISYLSPETVAAYHHPPPAGPAIWTKIILDRYQNNKKVVHYTQPKLVFFLCVMTLVACSCLSLLAAPIFSSFTEECPYIDIASEHASHPPVSCYLPRDK